MNTQKFFFRRLKNWNSPLGIFSSLQKLKNTHQNTHQNHHLFFSGETENPEISGKYSFIALETTGNTSYTVDTSEKWENLKTLFLEISENYKNDRNLKNWNFPFCGGITGVFSYDFVRVIEDIPENFEMNRSLPVSSLLLCMKFFAFDHQKKECYLAGWFDSEELSEEFFESYKYENMSYNISQIDNGIDFVSEISEKVYHEKFQICQNEIEKGNSFQINFSQKFLSEIPDKSSATGWDMFLIATQKNSAQMMYFYENIENDFALISCSPERLFSCDANQKIFTQPIAGTRPRGKNIKEEKKLEEELVTSLKEVSEHSMIVDLLRNDFGKVSQFGSVHVAKFMRVEKYATVMHLVSDISGKIAPEKNIFDVFESLFPGGTITGTPKIETMKILAREEVSSRNFYCGSAGYFSFCGSADWNILIRTLEKEGRNISGRAGGGLVYGASPKNEYIETRHKFSGIERIFS